MERGEAAVGEFFGHEDGGDGARGGADLVGMGKLHGYIFPHERGEREALPGFSAQSRRGGGSSCPRGDLSLSAFFRFEHRQAGEGKPHSLRDVQ